MRLLRKSRINWVAIMMIAVPLLILGAIGGGIVWFVKKPHKQTTLEPVAGVKQPSPQKPVYAIVDTAAYNRKLLYNANLALAPEPRPVKRKRGTPTDTMGKPKSAGPLWPVRTDYPYAGAILPFSRIVAFYGNLSAKRMGILGQYPADTMLAKLKAVCADWEAADSTTPVIPAFDYIVISAQGSPGTDGKYRMRMSETEIDKVFALAKQINAMVILDVQIGKSTLQNEIPYLEKYLKMPNAALAIDPEFSMKDGQKPGSVIGTFDAEDINYASDYLAQLVKENNLPPKILMVHRFTQSMVTNYQNIKTLPQVQVVMNMDGYGTPGSKIGTYSRLITKEPVQFTGFKLFYKNDLEDEPHTMLAPIEVLNQCPMPLVIQYQ